MRLQAHTPMHTPKISYTCFLLHVYSGHEPFKRVVFLMPRKAANLPELSTPIWIFHCHFNYNNFFDMLMDEDSKNSNFSFTTPMYVSGCMKKRSWKNE